MGFPVLVRWYLYIESAPVCFEGGIKKNRYELINLKRLKIFMMTSSNGNIFCITSPLCGEFTSHRWIPLRKKGQWTKKKDLRLNKQLIKQSWGWWFETPSCSSRRHCDITVYKAYLSLYPNGFDILSGISKVPFDILKKICHSLVILRKMCISFRGDSLIVLRSKNLWAFINGIQASVVLFLLGLTSYVIESCYVVDFYWSTTLKYYLAMITWSGNPLRAKFFRANINIYLHFM